MTQTVDLYQRLLAVTPPAGDGSTAPLVRAAYEATLLSTAKSRAMFGRERLAVATRPDVPVDVLLHLKGDPHPNVRAAALTHPAMPADELLAAIKREDQTQVLLAVADQPVSGEVLEVIAGKPAGHFVGTKIALALLHNASATLPARVRATVFLDGQLARYDHGTTGRVDHPAALLGAILDAIAAPEVLAAVLPQLQSPTALLAIARQQDLTGEQEHVLADRLLGRLDERYADQPHVADPDADLLLHILETDRTASTPRGQRALALLERIDLSKNRSGPALAAARDVARAARAAAERPDAATALKGPEAFAVAAQACTTGTAAAVLVAHPDCPDEVVGDLLRQFGYAAALRQALSDACRQRPALARHLAARGFRAVWTAVPDPTGLAAAVLTEALDQDGGPRVNAEAASWWRQVLVESVVPTGDVGRLPMRVICAVWGLWEELDSEIAARLAATHRPGSAVLLNELWGSFPGTLDDLADVVTLSLGDGGEVVPDEAPSALAPAAP